MISYEYEEVLDRLNPIIEAQARYVAAACQRLYQSDLDWQDLAQAARIYLWGYLERRGNPGFQLLAILGRLRMYAERCRGRSVLRPHPGKRKQHYQRATLAEANSQVCTDLDPFPHLSDAQECELLLAALQTARAARDDRGEHFALLALRRLGRAVQDEGLVADCNAQLRAWWKAYRQRLHEEEVQV